MKMIVIAIGLLFGSSVFADTTICSDAEGNIRFSYAGIQNAVPKKGDTTDVFEVRAFGQVLSRSVVRIDTEPDLGPISPELDIKNIKKLGAEQSGCLRTEDFATKLTLSKNPSSTLEIPEIALPLTAYVVCQKKIKTCN